MLLLILPASTDAGSLWIRFQNDISLFKNAIYGVQIGDYPYLNNFADEVIPAINAVIAEKIRLLFEKF